MDDPELGRETLGGGLVGRRTEGGGELPRLGGDEVVGFGGVAGVVTREGAEGAAGVVTREGAEGATGVVTREGAEGVAEGGLGATGWLPRMLSRIRLTTGTPESRLRLGPAAEGGIARIGARVSKRSGARWSAPGTCRIAGDSIDRGDRSSDGRPSTGTLRTEGWIGVEVRSTGSRRTGARVAISSRETSGRLGSDLVVLDMRSSGAPRTGEVIRPASARSIDLAGPEPTAGPRRTESVNTASRTSEERVGCLATNSVTSRSFRPALASSS